MIGPDFKFSKKQRSELADLKVNDRQIDALERIIPACAIYLSPGEVPTMTETRKYLKRTRISALALARLFDVENASPVEQQALRLIGRNMDLGRFAAAMHEHSAALIAAMDDALKEPEATAQHRDRSETMPLRLIYGALRDNHAQTYGMDEIRPDDAPRYMIYPSQSVDGTFSEIARIVYDAATSGTVELPVKALRELSKELKPRGKLNLPPLPRVKKT